MKAARTRAAAVPAAAEVPELVTLEEVAAALRVHRKTLERWSRTGEVPVKIDRPNFKRYVLAEVIEALAAKSSAPAYRAPGERPLLISDLMARKGGAR